MKAALQLLSDLLIKFPVASASFLAYAIVGGVMLVVGTLDYGSYSTNLLAVGIACGAIGVPRAISKVSAGHVSTNFLGFIESVPIPSVVFVVFLAVSSIALIDHSIVFGVFTTNIEKVGIACGVVQAARTAEHVFKTA